MLTAKWIVLATALVILCVAPAAGKPVKSEARVTIKGSVADEKLKKAMPESGVITNAKDFEKLIKAWNIKAKASDVVFDKELVLVATTVGSSLNLSATLDEKGDLKTLGFGTADFGEGFRYVIIAVSRGGVKTVNGKPLPK
jgi:hypothetical protein